MQRYLGLKQAVPIAVGHAIEVQIFGTEGLSPRHVVVRDLATGILYADQEMLVAGAPENVTVEGSEWAFRLQRLAPLGLTVRSQFRGRVVECSVISYDGARIATSLVIDEDEGAAAPYR